MESQRQTLSCVLDALRSQAHHLVRWPELTFPQLFNELYSKHSSSLEVKNWLDTSARRFARPWIRKTAPDTSRSSQLKATLVGHTDMVMACQFSPCDRFIASAAKDGSLRMWDISSAREISCLKGPDFQLYDCRWSPCGDRIATVGVDARVRIWDWKNERLARSIDPHVEGVTCCAWSPDGKGILCRSANDGFMLWDADTGAELWRRIEHEGRLRACAFSPDGRFLGLVTETFVTVIGLHSGEPAREVYRKRLEVASRSRCSFSNDGHLFAYDVDQCEVINTETTSSQVICWGAYDCALSPGGTSIVVAGGSYGDARLEIFDTADGNRLGVLNGHQDLVSSCDWSSDGRLIASGSRDGTVKVWDATGPGFDDELHHHRGVRALSWYPNGTKVLSAGEEGWAHLWDSESGSWLATIESRYQREAPSLTGCTFAADGGAFALCDWSGVVEVFESETRTSILKFQADEKHVYSCQWSPSGSRLVTCGTKGVFIWDARTGEPLGGLEDAGEPRRASFSPDGKRIAMWPGAIYDVEDRALRMELKAVRSYIWNELSWAPGSDLLLLGDHDLTVAVINAAESRAIGRLAGHKGLKSGSAYFRQFGEAAEVLCAFVGDGRFSVTAYVDGSVRIWDVFGEKLLTQFASDSAFWCLAARGRKLCLGDDQGHLHWFTVENLPGDLPVKRSPREDCCPVCGDRMEREDWLPGAEKWQCPRCLYQKC